MNARNEEAPSGDRHRGLWRIRRVATGLTLPKKWNGSAAQRGQVFLCDADDAARLHWQELPCMSREVVWMLVIHGGADFTLFGVGVNSSIIPDLRMGTRRFRIVSFRGQLTSEPSFGWSSSASGLMMVRPRAMNPCCMSSDRSSVQPASTAALTMSASQNCTR